MSLLTSLLIKYIEIQINFNIPLNVTSFMAFGIGINTANYSNLVCKYHINLSK